MKPLKDRLSYDMFIAMADSNKRDQFQIFISIAHISHEDRLYIIAKLNSMARSRFFLTYDNCIGAVCDGYSAQKAA